MSVSGSPIVPKTILVASDFPTPGQAVKTRSQFQVLATVTDNDPTRTNTGQSFVANDYIVWTGTAWNNLEDSTIPAGSVTNAMLANMAQATIKGRAAGAGTGSPQDLTGVQVRAIAQDYSTTATAGSLSLLLSSSTYLQYFTGSTTQSVSLPNVTTLYLGQSFEINNLSSGVITVQSSGSNTLQAMASNTKLIVTCTALTGTGTASWNWVYLPIQAGITGTGSLVRNVGASIGTATITSSTLGSADSTQSDARFTTPLVTITGDTTLDASHWGKKILLNSASAITITFPQQSTLTTVAGVWFEFENINVGIVTFAKQGAETLTGNTTAAAGAGGKVFRDTTTNWSVFGATAIINEQITGSTVGATVNQAYDISVYMPFAGTILGIATKSTTTAVAGTYTVAVSGAAVTGLTTVANGASGVRTYTAATAANTFVRGDYVTITLAGATMTDLFWALEYTRAY